MKNPTYVVQDRDYFKYKDIVIYQSKKIVYGLGDLSALEQHILDLFTSKITKDSNPNETFSIQMSEIIDYFGLKNGSAYQTINTNLEKMYEACLVFKDERTKGKVKRIRIFCFLGYNKTNGKIRFKFHPDIEPYLFNLKNGEFYSIDLATLRALKSKNVLILFKIWCANKTYNVETEIIENWKWWRVAFQGSKVSEKPWTASTVVLTVKRAFHILKFLFDDRYYFHVRAIRGGHEVTDIAFCAMGDTYVPYPVINMPNERKYGRELTLQKSSPTFDSDLTRIINAVGADRHEITMNSFEDTDYSIMQMNQQRDTKKDAEIEKKIKATIKSNKKWGNPDNDY